MTTRWKEILFPLGRIVLAVLLVGGSVAVAEVLVKSLEDVLSLGGAVPAIYYVAYLIVGVLVAYFAYRAYVRFVEKRAATELSGKGAPKELGIGMLVGFGWFRCVSVYCGCLATTASRASASGRRYSSCWRTTGPGRS